MDILLIEENGAVADYMAAALERCAMRVFIIDEGEDAVQLARNFQFDAMLLGLSLPDMSGFTVLNRLRKFNPALPVLVVTACDDRVNRMHAYAAGADSFMGLPTGRYELVQAVNALVHALPRNTRPADEMPPRKPNGRLLDILLVEDDEAMAASMRLLLETRGMRAYRTDFGEEALEMARRYPFDVVLLDLYLPDISGFEVLRALKANDARRPVLVVSGDDPRNRQRALAEGADGFVAKPFWCDALFEQLHALTGEA